MTASDILPNLSKEIQQLASPYDDVQIQRTTSSIIDLPNGHPCCVPHGYILTFLHFGRQVLKVHYSQFEYGVVFN